MARKRPFATGSKPGPDAIDHYLESLGLYRKHTARDGTSLFRVFSEQIIGVQYFHEDFRYRCVDFMDNYSKLYSLEVDKNFNNHLASMRKLKNSGTLLELRAMARQYSKNVILYEPNQNNTECTMREYIFDDSYDEEPLRIFYSYKDRHFDSIFELPFTEVLGVMQAIVMEILYMDVFKLADVRYAVERMLHDQKGEFTLPLDDDETKYKTENDEIIEFNTAEETSCVLKDPSTCHFHNRTNFEELVKKNKESVTIINRSDDPGRLKIFKPVDGYLYKTEISCVRQLLEENITPFPYKVAKALEPSMYRNIEFEVWQDGRKAGRQKWCDVNEKYVYYPNDPHFDLALTCCDQGYAPLDGYEVGNCIIPYDEQEITKGKMNSLAGYDIFEPQLQPSRDQVDQIVFPAQMHYNNQNYRQNYNQNGRGNGRGNARTFYNNNRQNQQQYYPAQREQQYVNQNREQQYMNLHREQPYMNQQRQQYHQYDQPPMQNNYPQAQVQYSYTDPNSPPPVYTGPSQNYQQNPLPYPQQTYNNNQTQCGPQCAPIFPAPPVDFSVPPPQIPANHQVHAQTQEELVVKEEVHGDYLKLVQEGALEGLNIDSNTVESVEANGSDLPSDLKVLQYCYNIGLSYLKSTGLLRSSELMAPNIVESIKQEIEPVPECVVESSSNDEVKPPESSAPTPKRNALVAPRPLNRNTVNNSNNNNWQNGGRGQYNNNNHNNNNGYQNNYRRNNQNYRGENGHQNGHHNGRGRGYNNNNNNNFRYQNGKDIQFNPNVKNVHKVDSNPQKVTQNGYGEANEQNDAEKMPQEQREYSPDSGTGSNGYGNESMQPIQQQNGYLPPFMSAQPPPFVSAPPQPPLPQNQPQEIRVWFEQGPFGPEGAQGYLNQQQQQPDMPPPKYDYFYVFMLNQGFYQQCNSVALMQQTPYVPHRIYTSVPTEQFPKPFDMCPVWKLPAPGESFQGQPQYMPVTLSQEPPQNEVFYNVQDQQDQQQQANEIPPEEVQMQQNDIEEVEAQPDVVDDGIDASEE